MNSEFADPHEILNALGELLEGSSPLFLVVVGGTAICAQGLVSRTTRDMDVVGEIIQTSRGLNIRKIYQWPDSFQEAATRIRRDFGLEENWLNSHVLNVANALPPGFLDRLVVRHYGSSLSVGFASRLDLIHLKLLASLDGPERHFQDLVALRPDPEEIARSVAWALSLPVPPAPDRLHDVLRELDRDFAFA